MRFSKGRHIITDEDIKRNHVLSEKNHHSGIVKNALSRHSGDDEPAMNNEKNGVEAQALALYPVSAPDSSGMFSMEPNINQGIAGNHIARMNCRLDDIEKVLGEIIDLHNRDAPREPQPPK